MQTLRVVIDSGVVISALITPKGTAQQLLDVVILRFLSVLSPETVGELLQVLARPKFNRYASAEERHRFVNEFIDCCETVPCTTRIDDCRDPKDNYILALALDAHADLIVSGDNDLLTLHPWRGIPILNPQDALTFLA